MAAPCNTFTPFTVQFNPFQQVQPFLVNVPMRGLSLKYTKNRVVCHNNLEVQFTSLHKADNTSVISTKLQISVQFILKQIILAKVTNLMNKRTHRHVCSRQKAHIYDYAHELLTITRHIKQLCVSRHMLVIDVEQGAE